jgi:heptosyltransferase-2
MKILVRGTNWVGDAVMTIPALRELRRIFPDAEISLAAKPWADALFRDADFLDEIITINKTKPRFRSIFHQADAIRETGFDLAVLLPNSFESALTTILSRIPRRIGYNKDLRGLLLTDPIAVPEWKDRRHEVFYYLSLVSEVERRVLGTDSVRHAVPDISLPVSDARRMNARKTLTEYAISIGDAPVIALGIGSTNSRAKRWPAKYFAELGDLLRRHGASVYLAGSPDDRDVADEVLGHAKTKPFDLVGKTDIGEAAAVLAETDLLISNDMGLAHIAPSVGTETIVIFGPTNPETTRPFSENALVVREPVECSPCMLRDCPIDHRCMTRILPEKIFDLAAEFFYGQSQLARFHRETG